MFLFYTLVCRNRLEIVKNAKGDLLEVDSDFPKICPFKQISEIVSLRPEYNDNFRSHNGQSCGKFP